ncbi:MAG: hypothetical protein E7319_07905 [Clostridiales bacterium]|nr:hypothetical protein [Clostridiales bacterium]
MELRLLDEVMALPAMGVMLLSMDEERADCLRDGVILTDALGRQHQVAQVTRQDGLFLLYLPEGDAAYFERLFRNVLVDATLVKVTGEGE